MSFAFVALLPSTVPDSVTVECRRRSSVGENRQQRESALGFSPDSFEGAILLCSIWEESPHFLAQQRLSAVGLAAK